MAFTTFSGVKAGTVRQNAGANLGFMVMKQTNTLTFSDTTKNICILPAGAQILFINFDVTTAFNAGTNNNLTVGITGTANQFVTTTSIAATGRTSFATTATYANWADVGTTDVQVTATYTQSGTAATTGAAQITIVYAQD